MFSSIEQLKIGKIIEVLGSHIVIELEQDLSSLTKSYRGKVYSLGQISSIIKILFGRKILFANVKSLKLRSELDVANRQLSIGEDQRVLEADLIGEGIWIDKEKRLDFQRGIEQYPLPLQSAFIMTEEELTYFYHGAEEQEFSDYDPTIAIGTYGYTNQVCRINADKFLGQHSAILGNTGSGKSGTVAAIIHAILSNENAKHPRIIMIDPHGEYSKAFKNLATTYTIGEDSENSKRLNLPYWIMNSEELRSLFIGKTEREATAQNNIIFEALSYARMIQAGIITRIDEDPLGNQKAKLCDGKSEEDRLAFDKDLPIPFKLNDFIFHIDKVQGRKDDKKERLSPSARQSHDSILRKIDVLRANPQLRFMLEEYSENSFDLAQILLQLLGGHKNSSGSSDAKETEENTKNIKIIDTSGLPSEVAGILIALLSRLIFQYKIRQTRDEREKDPVLLVYEEAHLYVPNKGEAQFKEAQEAIRRIAKEGRKYGIGLMLVSQRPADLESTVLSQCSSWVVLRLTNETDQSYVSSFIPDNLSGLLKLLPSLTRREAVIVGEAIALPSRIKIQKLSEDQLPDSNDIEFLKGWEQEYSSDEEINKVINRWIG